MKKEIIIGKIISIIIKIITKTLRKNIVISENSKSIKHGVVIFWHRDIIPTILSTTHLNKCASLVSPSKDGEILEQVLKSFGNYVIRGSSNKDNIKSLKNVLGTSKNGYSVGFAIDGPRGPIYEPKPGAIFVAEKLKLPLIIIGAYTEKKWIFEKAWDKFILPKPFSRVTYYVNSPVYINGEMEIEDKIKFIKDELFKANDYAREKHKFN